MTLKPDDFPLKAIGPNIYARNWSSPVLVATDEAMAAAVVLRLNREEFAQAAARAQAQMRFGGGTS